MRVGDGAVGVMLQQPKAKSAQSLWEDVGRNIPQGRATKHARDGPPVQETHPNPSANTVRDEDTEAKVSIRMLQVRQKGSEHLLKEL